MGMLVTIVVVTLATFLVGCLAWRMVLPSRPARLRLWLESWWRRIIGRVLPRQTEPPDPFEVLRIQARLSAVATELRTLEGNSHVYAKAHRLTAVRAAYDDLLGEACRLARVPVDAGRHPGEALRWEEEQQLAERGWSW
jgi:hypothetical protein